MFQEKWPDHTLVQDVRTIPCHRSHTPDQKHTLQRKQRAYLKVEHNFLLLSATISYGIHLITGFNNAAKKSDVMTMQ